MAYYFDGVKAKKVLSVVKSEGSTPTLITKSITDNGTYSAEDDNADGYSSVSVNVQGGGAEFNVHFGLTPPQETNKLWVETSYTPSAVSANVETDILSTGEAQIVIDTTANKFFLLIERDGFLVTKLVKIGVSQVRYKGSNVETLTAYLWDGTNWKDLNGTIRLVKFYPPTISISGNTLTITNDSRNGNHVTGYKIYSGSTLLTTISGTTLDLSTVISTSGNYQISVIATGTGYEDSNNSNVEPYIAGGYTVEIHFSSSYSGAFSVYDGQDDSGYYLGDYESSAVVTCNSGYLYIVDYGSDETIVQSTVVTGGISIDTETEEPYTGLFVVSGDGTISISLQD